MKDHVRTCEQCQCRSGNRYSDELHPTFGSIAFEKVGVDVIHMPPGVGGKKVIVVARDDFTGWVEARALSTASSKLVAEFLYQDVITCFGVPREFVMDGGPENKKFTEELARRFNIRQIIISAYHP